MEKTTTTTIECKDCKATFTMTEEEMKWYKDHDFELPKRCPDCRKKRKQERKTKKESE